MKLAYIRSAGTEGFAAALGDGQWVLLADLGLRARDTGEAITALACFPRKALTTVPPANRHDLTFGCPIVRPSKVIGVGYNYAAHAAETGAATPQSPVLFGKFVSSLTGPFDPIIVDVSLTSMADYEVELAVVIGRSTRGASAREADAIFGYAVANDVSARDCQTRDVQVSRSKGFDTFCPIGPWIVSADEVGDPQLLGVRSWVNGEPRQDASTAEMVFGVRELVEFISRGITLEPGDVILTGSPPGVGHGMSPPRYLHQGDVVECEVDHIGRIENRITNVGSGNEALFDTSRSTHASHG